MKDLLKDYLENAPRFKCRNVEIIEFDSNAENVCRIIFSHFYGGETVTIIKEINLWEVLAFVNNKIK